METKECILCGNIDIQTENNYDKTTVICKSCEAQYSISEKEKSIIKYPKYNLNPKYIANGFMIVRGLIMTKDDSLFTRVFTFFLFIMAGISLPVMAIYTNIILLKDIFQN